MIAMNDKPDQEFIFSMIPENSSVLDLGCGDGRFLHKLKLEKNCKVQGIDISQDQIMKCIAKGVPVIQRDLNEGMLSFPDQCFDYVILGQTFQQVEKPEKILHEMLRVGKNAVVSVVNLGYIGTRLQIVLGGKMPNSDSLPYEWYNTPNIHLGTHEDFLDMCKKEGIKVGDIEAFGPFAANAWKNLFAEFCVYNLKS